MKAVRVHRTGDASVLQVEDVDDPKPAAGEAVVRVEAAGVNFIDIYQRRGLYPRPMPFTPGSEGAGEVVAVGEGVTEVTVGDRVVSERFRGTYAELAILVSEARRVTGGRGVQVVYDSVGQSTFNDSLDSLAPRGMLVSFGQSSGPVGAIDPAAEPKGIALSHQADAGPLRRDAGRAAGAERRPVSMSAGRSCRWLEGRQTMGKVLLRP